MNCVWYLLSVCFSNQIWHLLNWIRLINSKIFFYHIGVTVMSGHTQLILMTSQDWIQIHDMVEVQGVAVRYIAAISVLLGSSLWKICGQIRVGVRVC